MNNKTKLVLFCVVICILTSCIRLNIILDDKDLNASETYETPTVEMKEDIKEENIKKKKKNRR